ncbi:MAG: DUF4342 domain-containing protein [Clostridium lundense]|nr:DUF4342 domain-containing protein [Clostridium lundense]
MSEITLEKIDIVRDRTGVSYAEAREALEKSEGNVVDALIFIEESKKAPKENSYTNKDEFVKWLKDLVSKGNVARIRIKKDEKVLLDIPVTAGLVVAIPSLIYAPLITLGVFAAALTQITIEITKKDGTVEVVNKILKSTVEDVKEKAQNAASKVQDSALNVKDKFTGEKSSTNDENNNVYTYTVDFEEIDEESNSENKEK